MTKPYQMRNTGIRLVVTSNMAWYAHATAMFLKAAIPKTDFAVSTDVEGLERHLNSSKAALILGVPNRDSAHGRLLEALRREWPETPLGVVSSDGFPDLARKSRDLQVASLITTGEEPSAVRNAIRALKNGETFYTYDRGAETIEQAPRHFSDDIAQRVEKLTRRERQVMELLGLGYANREIADSLDLREGTVRIYVHRIIRQLDLRNRVDVALCANYLAGLDV